MLEEEGLDNVFSRHQRLADSCRAAVDAWELETVCLNPREHSNALTGIMMPDGHDADYVRQVILAHFNMSLGTGLGKIKGKAFRIGHLGDINELMLMGVICGVEMGLGLGWRAAPVRRGGGRYAVPCAVKLTPEIRNKPEKDMKKYDWQPLLLSSQLPLQHQHSLRTSHSSSGTLASRVHCLRRA